jgi:hypothetical protein
LVFFVAFESCRGCGDVLSLRCTQIQPETNFGDSIAGRVQHLDLEAIKLRIREVKGLLSSPYPTITNEYA